MKVISMEDFVIQTIESPWTGVFEKDVAAAKLRKIRSYARFMKNLMTWEDFNGPEAIVKIKDVSVLKPSVGHPGEGVIPTSEINLLFVPDEDNNEWRGIFSVGHHACFGMIVSYPGIEFTKVGIKKIFG